VSELVLFLHSPLHSYLKKKCELDLLCELFFFGKQGYMADDDDAQDLLLLVLFSPFLEIGKNERELMKILSLFVEFIFLLCPPPPFFMSCYFTVSICSSPPPSPQRERRKDAFMCIKCY
jgi:hypothetical protein